MENAEVIPIWVTFIAVSLPQLCYYVRDIEVKVLHVGVQHIRVKLS